MPESLSAEALANTGSIVLHETHGRDCNADSCAVFGTPAFASKVLSTTAWEYSESKTPETIGEYIQGDFKKR